MEAEYMVYVLVQVHVDDNIVSILLSSVHPPVNMLLAFPSMCTEACSDGMPPGLLTGQTTDCYEYDILNSTRMKING